jgi:hypothetical protein
MAIAIKVAAEKCWRAVIPRLRIHRDRVIHHRERPIAVIEKNQQLSHRSWSSNGCLEYVCDKIHPAITVRVSGNYFLNASPNQFGWRLEGAVAITAK